MQLFRSHEANLIAAACIANSYAMLEIILAAGSQIIVANIAVTAESNLVT